MENNNGLRRLFFLFLIPIIVAFLFELIFKEFIVERIFNVIENILFSIVLLTPLCFLSGKVISKAYFTLALIVFSFFLCFETLYFYLFNTNFSPSSIFVILDSNTDEASEFVSFYSDIKIKVFVLLLALITFVILIKELKVSNFKFNVSRQEKLKVIGMLVMLLLILKVSKLIVYNLPYLFIKSSIEYREESKVLGDYKSNFEGDFNKVSRVSIDENEVYVVVIGESTSRSHFGLYNYYRQTTPELNKYKSDLLIFNDVISPHVFSIWSLTKVLTLGNYENPDGITEGSIIQLINKAGFKTYWLSNQRPIGPYESLITKISLSASKHEFITTTIAGNSRVLDEELLPELDKALMDKASKKVIFVHLMGTHHHYENRYPEAFNIFKDEPQTNFKSCDNFEKINNYDNAVLYNDYIVNEVINKVNRTNLKSFVLYFSDHGEEVFDNIAMSGHNEDVYSKNMYDVPFILWRSEQYKANKQLDYFANRKYMLDDVFHSIADLLDIKALETDTTRSIFNSAFKERKRVIKDSLDYDVYFKDLIKKMQ